MNGFIGVGCPSMTEMVCCGQCMEPYPSLAWSFVIEFIRIFLVVKIVFWMLTRVEKSARKWSPRIRPVETKGDFLLRTHLVYMNWKILANKARALYYIKRSHQRRRLAFSVNQKSMLLE